LLLRRLLLHGLLHGLLVLVLRGLGQAGGNHDGGMRLAHLAREVHAELVDDGRQRLHRVVRRRTHSVGGHEELLEICVDVRTVATGECHTPIELSLELAAPLREAVRGGVELLWPGGEQSLEKRLCLKQHELECRKTRVRRRP
jgi:hypothetical protein